MTGRQLNLWMLLVCTVFLVVALVQESSPAAVPAIASSSVFTRLRRVQQPSLSTVVPPQDTPRAEKAGSRRSLKTRSPTTTTATNPTVKLAGERRVTQKAEALGESLRQRLGQTVQKVRARSKEFQMEQEQKRVDRKLRRDQKKSEREQPTLAASINPHNLQMPDCAAGKVYNGRRCVVSGKIPNH